MTTTNEITPDMNTLVKIVNLKPEQIEKVYSGRPGCGCGCRGKYYEDARNIKRVLKAMREEVASAETISYDTEYSGGNSAIAAVETERRYYWAYVK